MKTFIKMLRDNSGASAAEYALILAIVGAGMRCRVACFGRFNFHGHERRRDLHQLRKGADLLMRLGAVLRGGPYF